MSLGNRPTDLFLPSQGHVAWTRELRPRSRVLGTDGFQLVYVSMRNHIDKRSL
jgi:hypothetical protein